MKNIFIIAFTDVKLMFKDKMFFFWILILPLLFIFIFSGQSSDVSKKASISVLNMDKGEWGRYFVKKIEDKKVTLQKVEKFPDKFIRMLVIPENFSEKIFDLKEQVLELKLSESADSSATRKIQMKLIKVISEVITEIALTENIKNFFTKKIKLNNLVTLKSIFPKNTILKIPSGQAHTIPGILIMFIMMNTLIYGGAMLLLERKKGVIQRMMLSPLSVSQLWIAKIFARTFLGLIQTLILLTAGFFIFTLNFGNLLPALMIVLIFAISVSALSIFLGSVFNSEEIVIGLSILASQIFAGLGGCWWPIEVVSDTVKKVGMSTPSYWAMDAFHKLLFFNKNLIDIIPNIIALTIFTAFFALLSIKFFKIRDE